MGSGGKNKPMKTVDVSAKPKKDWACTWCNSKYTNLESARACCNPTAKKNGEKKEKGKDEKVAANKKTKKRGGLRPIPGEVACQEPRSEQVADVVAEQQAAAESPLLLMPDLKECLLPPKPASAINLRDPSYRPSASGRQPFHGVDFLGLKKRGQGLRSWIRVDALGNSQVIEVDKFTMMRRCDLPPRDLRLLDPLFVYPSTILGREKAIVVNLEQIRCIITADEVFILNSLDNYVLQYVVELERRLKTAGAREVWQSEGTDLSRRRGSRSFDNMFGSMSPDYLPFEFRALEVALESACTFLDSQISHFCSESRILIILLIQVRDEIEQLMDDDGDMAEMYLTEKKMRTESVFCGDQSLMGYRSTDGMQTASAPVSPVPSPPESRKLEKSLSIVRSQHESIRSTESTTESIEEMEMLLEAYFVVIDSTLNKLTSVRTYPIHLLFCLISFRLYLDEGCWYLKEYIDDTEDFINIHLDNVRNQLIQFELLLTTATFVVAIFGVVAGIFGMNFTNSWFDVPGAFKWVLIITGVTGAVIFSSFLWFFRYRRLMPL
ncbi:hypothetical protein RHGRI_024736 [Rhododendron griersonianum]|uniref:Magnesium transporter n=1 Tax=Rhododendron griersonianum TaxID=479676 RepID=A0AAV6JAV6_9ERIC|nr:hypothetical protein RHGRI_024736 [Rhododendron griersonianum]